VITRAFVGTDPRTENFRFTRDPTGIGNRLALWGICFSLKANPNAIETFDSCTVRAQTTTEGLVINGLSGERQQHAPLREPPRIGNSLVISTETEASEISNQVADGSW
jgi:hypothetical protein